MRAGKPFNLQLNTTQAEERLRALGQSAGQLLIRRWMASELTASALAAYERATIGRQSGSCKRLNRCRAYDLRAGAKHICVAIRDEHEAATGLSAKDALDLEQRIAAAQERLILRQETQSLDTLLSGIMTALENPVRNHARRRAGHAGPEPRCLEDLARKAPPTPSRRRSTRWTVSR